MSMVINHNMMGANAARTLNTHYGNLATSTQRLSSGLRINSAADDAAGLAIRELMRADIAAYNQGIRNANDAISMIQVVDGALGIIDEKLIRMKELAEQAATGTYDSTQRLMIDSEFQAMASEIQRIATATDFNGIKLIDGSVILPKNSEYVQEYSDFKTSMSIINTPGIHGVSENCVNSEIKITNNVTFIQDGNDIYKKTTITEETVTTTEQRRWIIGGEVWGLSIPGRGYTCEILNPQILDSIDPNWMNIPDRSPEVNISLYQHLGEFNIVDEIYEYVPYEKLINKTNFPNSNHYYHFFIDLNNDGLADIKNTQWSTDKVEWDDINKMITSFRMTYERNDLLPIKREIEKSINEHIERYTDSIKIHFGPMNDSAEDYYDIEKRDCTLKGLGLEWVRIETQDNAQEALVTINDAIVKKDQARAYYGAMQNRLENTVSNLTIQAENLQASESRISDVDVATEMTNFVRNQILTQSAVAMLSQANSMPQMAMQLIG